MAPYLLDRMVPPSPLGDSRLQFDASTSEECLKFLQQLSYISAVQILHLRGLLPVTSFKKIKCEGLAIYQLNLKDEAARKVYNRMKQPINAIHDQLLKRFVISIRRPEKQPFEKSTDDYGTYADEAYTIKLAYGQNGRVLIIRESDGQVVNQLSYEGPDSVKMATIKLLQAIEQLKLVLEPLPKRVDYYFRVALVQPEEFVGYSTVKLPQQIADGGYKCLSTIMLKNGRMMLDVQSAFLKHASVSSQALTLQSNPNSFYGGSQVFTDEFSFEDSSRFPTKFELDEGSMRTLSLRDRTERSASLFSGSATSIASKGRKKTEEELMRILEEASPKKTVEDLLSKTQGSKATQRSMNRSSEQSFVPSSNNSGVRLVRNEFEQQNSFDFVSDTVMDRSVSDTYRNETSSGTFASTHVQDTLFGVASLSADLSSGSEGIDLDEIEQPRKKDSPRSMRSKTRRQDESMHGSVSNTAVADTVRRRIPASPLQTTSELPLPHKRVGVRGRPKIHFTKVTKKTPAKKREKVKVYDDPYAFDGNEKETVKPASGRAKVDSSMEKSAPTPMDTFSESSFS